MHQIAILTSDERLVEMLRTSGLRVTGIDQAELARYSRATDAPQVLVVDMRGLRPASFRTGGLPPAALGRRRRARRVYTRSTPDARSHAGGVSECVAEPLAAKALDEAVRRVLTNVLPADGGPGICLHRCQRRRRRLDNRRQHGGDAWARVAEPGAPDRYAHRPR